MSSSTGFFNHLAVFACLISLLNAIPEYGDSVPNAKNVVIQGITVIGLGHDPINAPTGRRGANPFGDLVLDFEGGLNTLWPAICGLDTDLDGRSNGIEMCDPDCLWRVGDSDPICADGLVPTHPGIQDSDGIIPDLDLDVPAYIKAHAALMIIAWVFLAPVGILSAVILKKGKGKTWFKIHRACMYSTALLTLVAFIILAAIIGTSTITGSLLHPKLGIVVLTGALIQPISGYFRIHLPPAGEAKSFKRLAWEYQHQWTGRGTMALAVGSLVTGIKLGFNNDSGGKFVLAVFLLVTVGSFIYVLGFRDGSLGSKKDAIVEKFTEPAIRRPSAAGSRKGSALSNEGSKGNVLRWSASKLGFHGSSTKNNSLSNAAIAYGTTEPPSQQQSMRYNKKVLEMQQTENVPDSSPGTSPSPPLDMSILLPSASSKKLNQNQTWGTADSPPAVQPTPVTKPVSELRESVAKDKGRFSINAFLRDSFNPMKSRKKRDFANFEV